MSNDGSWATLYALGAACFASLTTCVSYLAKLIITRWQDCERDRDDLYERLAKWHPEKEDSQDSDSQGR